MRAYRSILCGLGIVIGAYGPAAAQAGSESSPEPPIAFQEMPTPADSWAGDRAANATPARRTSLLARLRHRLTDLTPAEAKLLSNPHAAGAFHPARPPAATVAPAIPSRGGSASPSPAVVHVIGGPSAQPPGSSWAGTLTGQRPSPSLDRPVLRGPIPPPRSVSPDSSTPPSRIPPPRPVTGTNAVPMSARAVQPGVGKIVIPPPPSAPIPQEIQGAPDLEPLIAGTDPLARREPPSASE